MALDLYPLLSVTTRDGTTLRVGAQFRLAFTGDLTASHAFSDMVVVGFRVSDARGPMHARLVRPYPTVVLGGDGRHRVFFDHETLDGVNVEDLVRTDGSWARLSTDHEPLVHVLATVTSHDALSEAAIAAAAILVADGHDAALKIGKRLGDLAPAPLEGEWSRPNDEAEALVDSADRPFLRRVLAALPWQWAYRAAAALVAAEQVRPSGVPAVRA